MAEIEPEHSTTSPNDASGSDAARGVLLSALFDPGAAERLRQMDASGVLSTLIPELEVLKGVEQPKEHYWDVYRHCLESVRALEFVVNRARRDWPETNLSSYLSQNADGECSRLVVLKIAGLLHDIAKPQTKFVEPKGRMRFFGHSEVGAETARRILSRLGFSPRVRRMVGLMIEHHLRPALLTLQPQPPTERAIFRFFRDTVDVGIETFLLNLADHKAMRGPLLTAPEWRQHMDRTRDIIGRYLARQEAREPAKLVDGNDLMARFGLRPGPLVGQLLAAVQKAQERGKVASKEAALALVEEMLSQA